MNGNVVPAPLVQRLAELPREAALRLALGLDAAITGANGVAYVALAGVLDSPLGLDETLLRGAGAALIHRFHWIIYIFGAFLVYTGIKIFLTRDSESEDPSDNAVVRLFRKFARITPAYESNHMFVKRDGKWWATPLMLVLVIVETSDLIFAVDSIPAIFAVTTDPFIVYTSNVFAILGLACLAFAVTAATFVITDVIYPGTLPRVVAASLAGAFVVGWVVVPLLYRRSATPERPADRAVAADDATSSVAPGSA